MRAYHPTLFLRDQDGALTAAWSRLLPAGRDCVKDTIAGLIASVVLIANIVSFGALMFPGDLSAGIPTAIWSMLIGSCIGGVWIALSTSLPPLATGIDSPTGAVLVLLSASAGSTVVATGASPQAAVQTVMLFFTGATVMSGALLYGLGACRWGSYFRFVPYFVVGGFLAATGWFLIAGGVRMTTGRTLALSSFATTWTVIETAKLATAVAALIVLLVVRHWIRSAFAMPAALLAMWLTGATTLHYLGLSGPEHGWYFHSLEPLAKWSPLEAAQTSHLTGSVTVGLVLELLAVTIVALVSLVTKVSSIEVARQTSGDLDCEFRAHGIASLIAAPFGGLISSLQTGTSRLLEHAGGATRMSGVVCALALGAVGVANFNLPGLIPIPIVAGLVFYLGYTFIIDGLWRSYSQRAWIDLILAGGIMIVCIEYGYLMGVLVGLVCACVVFAISYARSGVVVRRHMTRALFTSYVDRSAEASEYLCENGDAIQLYWLTGYIFFGSSEGVFERIRVDIQALPPRRVAHLILDFGLVSGADSSAVISLSKLRSFCDQRGITLIYSSLSSANRAAFELGGFFGGRSQQLAFADVNLALAWCEDQLLAKVGLETDAGLVGFESWLQHQLGASVTPSEFVAYLERRDTDHSEVLYCEGGPADTVDLVAAGNLAIDIAKGHGERLRVRRIMTHTVVGEMGFFRRSVRSATVSSEGPATIFTMTRANFERMRRERPDLANAFYDFLIRALAYRIDFSNRAITALGS